MIGRKGGIDMPGMDRRGPLGLGPKTGRALGMCALGVGALRRGVRASRGLRPGPGFGPEAETARELGPGSGFGRALGRGLGCGLMLRTGYGCMRALHGDPEDNNRNDRVRLEKQKQYLEIRLQDLNRQLDSMAGDGR